ncbi:MAG TPA: hypothetical protein VH330_01975 [Candidatus Udaeobacter sp.]|jgi:hypothetical protein
MPKRVCYIHIGPHKTGTISIQCFLKERSGPWAEAFAGDLSEEFAPNDYEISLPRWTTKRRIRRAVREITAMVQKILLDTALTIDAPWNDLHDRTGWISRK